MLLAGDDDVAAGAVSFRYRSGEQKNGVPVDEAVARDHRRGEPPGPGLTGVGRERARAGDLCCIHGLPGVREARTAGRGRCA
jgi:hypothetical protein